MGAEEKVVLPETPTGLYVTEDGYVVFAIDKAAINFVLSSSGTLTPMSLERLKDAMIPVEQ